MAATKLATARTIGGVAFDGTSNINLPGVNTTGNQSTTGNAATATKLATARTIAGVSFDGTANITLNAANVSAVARNNVAGPLKTSLLDTTSEVYSYNAALGDSGWPWVNSSATILSMGWSSGSDKGGAELAFNIAGRGLAYRAQSTVDGLMGEWKQVYHEGFKPTPADVGAVAKSGDTMTGALTVSQASAQPGLILERTNLSYNVSMLFKSATLSNYLGMDRNGRLRYGSAVDVDATGSFVYTSDNKPTAEDVGATSREVYVGEGFRSLGPTQSNVGGDYLYRWYKLCEHTTSALVDTTFDIIVSADKNYAGSSGRYYVSVSRYEGSGDPVGSLHVSVNRKYGAPDMIELAVKKEAGGTTVWVRGKRMWGNIGVSVINRGTDGGKPTFVADGTFVLSNDAILAGTVKMSCGNIYDGDTGALSYAFNEYFNKVHDSGSRVYSPVNKPSAADIGAL